MDEIKHPHDHFFQHSFARREVTADFLRNYLPEPVRRLLDLDTLELTKDSFVDEALRDHFSDLLYQLRLRDGSTARVYLLFEHKSYVGAAMLQVTLQVMKHIFSGELAQRLPGILGLLQELAQQQTGLEFLYTVLRYVSQSGRNVTAEDIQQAVVTVFPEEGKVLMATAAEQWMERGKELGKQEGIVLGKQEGERRGKCRLDQAGKERDGIA